MKQNKNTPEVSQTTKMEDQTHDALPFGRSNYMMMILGVALIVVGYFVMTMDKEEFGFGFLGITLGPIIAFAGFIVEFYAILKKKS